MQDKADPTPPEFWDRADEIIALANAPLKNEDKSKVSASTLYAVARFNAFVSATNYADGDQMTKDLSDITEYFVDQYKKMLDENLRDFAANHAAYVGKA